MAALRTLLLLALLVIAVPLRPAAASAAEPARSADAFVDSIGVNVHMTYLDTAYRDRARLVDKLSEAGIRHVRDGLHWNTKYAYATFNELAARGIRATFIMGEPTESHDTLEQKLAALKGHVLGAAEAVEGPNEYSYSGDPLWAPHLRDYHRRLYAAIKADPALAHLPVVAPSLISPQDHDDLGSLTDALDFGNKHSYPSADMPEANLDSELSVAARVSGDRPVWVTETGYHNALATKGGHRPISEAGAATYLPRMFLEYFRRGVPRTFAYELIDLWPDPEKRDQERNFGLLRNDYSEKPAFRSLENLIALLSDRGGAHPVQPLDLQIDGAPSDLRKLVLQKRDGSYRVVLWRAVRVWDPVRRVPLAADTRTVTVRAGGVGHAALFAPVESASAFASVPAAGGISVSLGADPIVIELPAAAGAEDGAPGDYEAPTSPPDDPEPPTGTPESHLPTSEPGRSSRPGAAAPGAPAGRAPTRHGRSTARVAIPRRQGFARFISKGLVVRCWGSGSADCHAAATYRGRVVAHGRSGLTARRSTRLRARPTRSGRRLLRRALRRSGSVVLRVSVRIGPGRAVTRRVRLR